MKIRTRIFLIVAVLGLVVCVVGGIAVYLSVSFTQRVQQLENASARAFNGEHLNRLVTAVVMDARGIYASDTVEQATPFAEGIGKSLGKIDAHLAEWRTLYRQVRPKGSQPAEGSGTPAGAPTPSDVTAAAVEVPVLRAA